ncbi:hypothetical protein H310_14981 [Aphanomyces invadans]|uniref:Uncharacterized protein n=1 Tax=Aphanomyces invadans TaxID=157072 RepID=A0A024T8A8_9STRA|nr:hypothetical protein H310_14981 [Aphanomyces invadans]ETV90184.1 hypothetical protein H310_14981 [Aphanomyces invadans]|eukprot:XP_008881183.1 hypothetical protein H310_14981 [Aphanomyces invadans]
MPSTTSAADVRYGFNRSQYTPTQQLEHVVTSTPHHTRQSNHVLEASTTHHFDAAHEYDELDTNDAGSSLLDTMTDNHHLMQHSPPFPSCRRHPHRSLGPSTYTNDGPASANNPTANGKELASPDSAMLLRVTILDCSTM